MLYNGIDYIHWNVITLYDSGGGGSLMHLLDNVAHTHLILELHYYALGTVHKK